MTVRRSSLGLGTCAAALLSTPANCTQPIPDASSCFLLGPLISYYRRSHLQLRRRQPMPSNTGQSHHHRQSRPCERSRNAFTASYRSPKRAAQCHPSLQHEQVHGERSRPHPRWAHGLRHDVEAGQNANPCRARRKQYQTQPFKDMALSGHKGHGRKDEGCTCHQAVYGVPQT